MNTLFPDDGLPCEMLAAWIDGELSVEDGLRVEQWLVDHPEAAAELADQEAFSPSNEAFRHETAVPMPSAVQWNGVLAEIERAVLPKRRTAFSGRWVGWGGIVAAGVAASVLILVGLPRRGSQPKPSDAVVPVAIDPADEPELFLVAQGHEVEIFRVPGDAHRALVVGEHPLEGVPLMLAHAGDLEVLSFDGMEPSASTTEEPGATMLWPPQKK